MKHSRSKEFDLLTSGHFPRGIVLVTCMFCPSSFMEEFGSKGVVELPSQHLLLVFRHSHTDELMLLGAALQRFLFKRVQLEIVV